jgi:magnesium transporter
MKIDLINGLKLPSLYKKKSSKTGLPPGTLVYTGEAKPEPVRIDLIEYNETTINEKKLDSIGQIADFQRTEINSWINFDGIHDVGLIEHIGQEFHLHPLVLEDIAHIGQRSKMEDYGDYLYIVLKMLQYNENTHTVEAEQVSMILGPHWLLTFQEHEGDVFEMVRQRIRSGKGRVRKMACDYLAYALIDAIVDYYFHVLELLSEQIEELEEVLLNNPTDAVLGRIHSLKRELTLLRKSVWPLRELVAGLDRLESGLVEKPTKVFVRDLYDHTIQIIDTIESFREVVAGMMDLYMSAVSNRMNAVMKVLTVIATIFIPLGFVAGIFGMNFDHMPELQWQWAYPLGFWLMIGVIVIGMLVYFKVKKWL